MSNQNCENINSCNYCNFCYFCKNLKMTECNIFCYAEKHNGGNSFQQKRYRAFNKEVGEKRYYEITRLIRSDILKGLKLELDENRWRTECKKVSNAQWKRILEIPEADKKVIEAIIGFELDLDDEEEMTMEEVNKALGKKVKIIE